VNNRRLTGRDYKRSHRSGFAVDLSRLRELCIGFGAGLCVAGLLYLATHHAADPPAQYQRPTARNAASADSARSDLAGSDASLNTLPPRVEGKYDFYQMLPKFEVVVPEKERGSRVAPTAPGTYFLQVGSYRDADVADRVHAQLTKLGIDSTVQRVAVDSDVWHRVRVGPFKDLTRLSRMREQLHASDLDSLIIRIDE
jgi:cell division septation protein DedD